MFKLVVFDLDGTLVDSRQDLAQATNRLLVEHGGESLEQDQVVHMVGEGVERLITRAFTAAGLLPVPADALGRFLELYSQCLLVHTRAYAGVPEALQELAQVTALAVLTNKPREFSERILQALGLSAFFGDVLGGDGPHARKPAPDGLLRLVEDFDAAVEDTVLVGDSAIDLRTARAAGTAIALARYGFGFRDVPRDLLKGDEIIVDTPGDLIAALQEHRPAGAQQSD